MLGNNYRNDPGQFAADLDAILQRLSPRPTLLLTVTEFKDAQSEVNYVVRSLAPDYPNVHVVDWAARTNEAEELLGDDGLHLSEAGRAELARMIGMRLLAVDGAGECLGSEYDDDSQAPDIDLDDVDGDDAPPAANPEPDPGPQPTTPATAPDPTTPPAPPTSASPPAPPSTSVPSATQPPAPPST
jgi:hypothetical protein